jgi:hypothetical protein
MATLTVTHASEASLLRRTLRANAIFSTISGMVCIGGSGPLAAFLGLGSQVPMIVLGAGLLLFAVGVFMAAAQVPLDRRKARIIILMDAAWVIGSILVVVDDPFALTVAGKWAVLGVADIVGVFAALQYIGLRRLRAPAGATAS